MYVVKRIMAEFLLGLCRVMLGGVVGLAILLHMLLAAPSRLPLQYQVTIEESE